MATARQKNWHGMNWIRPERRLGLLLRDGLACVWCQAGIEDGDVILTLDHLKPFSKQGGTENSNLICACKRCNSSRGNRSVAAFARAVAAYLNHGVEAKEIVARVRAAVRRPVPMDEAKLMLARRGNFSGALAELRTQN